MTFECWDLYTTLFVLAKRGFRCGEKFACARDGCRSAVPSCSGAEEESQVFSGLLNLGSQLLALSFNIPAVGEGEESSGHVNLNRSVCNSAVAEAIDLDSDEELLKKMMQFPI